MDEFVDCLLREHNVFHLDLAPLPKRHALEVNRLLSTTYQLFVSYFVPLSAPATSSHKRLCLLALPKLYNYVAGGP